MKTTMAAAAFIACLAAAAEEYPVLVNYPGDVGKQGWTLKASEAGKVVYIPFEGYYESKGGRIEGPVFTFDKKEGETAFYQLTYTSKSRSDGYWWCDFFDRDGKLLPDINSRLYLDNDWKTYTVQFPCDPRAVKGQLAFVSSKGCTVKDVSLRRVSVADAAKWCDEYYKTLPQVKMDVPNNPFHYLPKTLEALHAGRKLRVVLLGDSIVNDTYCSCFTALVMRDFPNVEFIISVRGSTGVYYYHQAEHFEEYCGRYKPDLVMIGGISNHSGNFMDTQNEMEETIDRCRAIGAEVVVMTPPPSYEWRRDSRQTSWDENFCCWAYSKWMRRMMYWTPMWQDYQRKACANKLAALWDMTTGPANAIAYSRMPLNWFKRDGAHNDDRGKHLIGRTLAAFFHRAKSLPAKNAFRPPAVPIFVNDPFFSVWARGETLTSADTTNWECWKEHDPDFNSSAEPRWVYSPAPFGVKVQIGDRAYRLCGREPQSMAAMPQVSCEVRPLSSVYRFADDRTDVELVFSTPFLTDDLDAFSRPVSYITLKAVQRDGVKRAVSVRVSAGGEVCSDDSREPVVSEVRTGEWGAAVRMGRVNQLPCTVWASRPTWGYLWIAAPAGGAASADPVATPADEARTSVSWSLAAADRSETSAAVAYEYGDKAGTFIGADLKGWWARDGKSFESMLAEAVRDYPRLRAKMDAFDAALTADLKKIGGGKYADLAALAYRQSYGACKLFRGVTGRPYLCSKENGSGSMISTTDVLYPQFPLMLLTSLDLAKATLRPVMEYAASGKWPYPYAPHDLGIYPKMEGQHYGMRSRDKTKNPDSFRMPVEESGNMLICLAAVAQLEGNAGFAGEWWPVVTKWAEYLAKFGFDPADQLCTDDFAGHLAHNANLSIKAIMGLASYSKLSRMRGDAATADRFLKLAADSVPKWIEAAKGGAEGGYRLAFDREGSWSMKYNLVWDRLLGFNLFPKDVAKAEMKTYRAKMNAFGLPLDSRSNYTKADWIVWTATLTGDRADFDALIDPLWESVDKTPDRVPMTDWYWADSSKYKGFKARSVVGGFFLPAIYDTALVEKWCSRGKDR
ncbi:MAG: DUF4965 domain-containing protein [Kiritimatiellae bacterium]|nr:DUF4965 domain-containing protein [Kiritimatiellia bacterium]